MADTTEGDTIVPYLGQLVSELIALTAGVVIHSFIIGVNVNDWWKGRSVTPLDHIVTSLGIFRVCTHCTNTLYLFVKTLTLGDLYSKVPLTILDAIYDFSTYANIWLTSLLSIVLCLKISNLQTRLFLCLRRMILHRTVYLIVSSLLLSALNCLMASFLSINEVSSGGTNNKTMNNSSTDCTEINSISYFTIGAFFPLLFYYVSSVLLFTSLYHHTTRMKLSSNLSINLETYYSLMRFVSFTFIYTTIYLIFHFVIVFYCEDFVWLFIIVDFLPALHSSYLIYRTAKLRDQMSKVIHSVFQFLFHGKDTDIREHRDVNT